MDSIDKPFDNQKKVKEFCEICMKERFISVDTEFLRTNTYFPKLCLIQLANSNSAIIIDALAVKNLEALEKLLSCKDVIKVFHAPRQDIEIFYNLFKKLPKNIFDTQIAASFLGENEQISYDKLVEKYLNIKINKNHQFCDWAKRPLNYTQIKYALSDVTYLREIYIKLSYQLSKLKRLDWATEESQKFLDIKLYKQNPLLYWKKIKFNKNKKISLNKLKLLTRWREEKCMEYNLTRNFLLSDKNIINLLSKNNLSENDISRHSKKNLTSKEKREILKILSLKENSLINKNFTRINVDKTKLNELKKKLKQISLDVNISETLIATVSELRDLLVNKDNTSPIFKGWRYKVFGYLFKKL